MALGNAIALGFTSGGGSIPASGKAMFWLNGEISGSEFVDQTANGRNFTITNKDFTEEYFPYKSVATISAPAADAPLIAADINNFLYDSGGTPNEIPVIAFFQNIDYENKLFCRHIAQVLDGNGVETTEPSVIDIVLYNAVLTGSELTTAALYYGATAYTAAQYWVDPDGNDTTGDGSKALPWLTVDHATDTVSDGKKVYIKSGAYPGEVALGYIFANNSFELHGIGLAVSEAAAANYGFRVANIGVVAVSRLSIKPQNATNSGMYVLNAMSLVFDKISLDNNAALGLNASGWKEVHNSIFYGTYTYIIQNTLGTVAKTIAGNIFKGVTSSGSVYITIAYLQTITNNIFRSNGGISIYANQSGGGVIIKGNTFEPDTAVSYIIRTRGEKPNTITYNTFKPITALALYAVDIAESYTNIAVLSNNKIDNSNGANKQLFRSTDSSLLAENNIIDAGAAALTGGADIYQLVSTANAKTSVIIRNNWVRSKRLDSYHLAVGTEATGAGDNSITTIEVSKNYVEGKDTAGAGPGSFGNHGALVGFEIDAAVRWNFIWGSFYGFVIKGSTGTVYTTEGVYGNILLENTNGILVKGAQALNIVNNTIICKTIDMTYGVHLADNTGSDEADNCVVKNNIIIAMGSGIQVMVKTDLTFAAGSNVVDYNLYYAPNGTMTFNENGVSKTWAEWQALGFDANSKVLSEAEFNALFEDYANNDFSLPVGSEAIGYGDTLAATYDDGLDESTDWGDADTVPSVVTKQRTGSWDVGAYVS